MATLAEIAKNPARPVKAIDELMRKGQNDSEIARQINDAIAATGRKFKPLTAANVAYYRKIHHPSSRTVTYKTKKGPKTRTLSAEQILAGRAKAAQRRQAQRSAGLSDIPVVFAKQKGGGVPHITSKMRERLEGEAYLRGQLAALKSKLGMKTKSASKRQAYIDRRLALPTIGAQVGKYARKRNVGGMVAMNPAFGNPAFNFTKEAIIGNVISGTQTSIGVVAGVAAAKYGNDLVVEKIMQSLFKKDPAAKVSIWQRLATAAITGIVGPGLVRSFLPDRPWVDKVADGMVAGSALYVLGGIEMQGKPVINIGQMVGAGEKEVIIDRNVNQPVSNQVAASERYVIDQNVSAYDRQENRDYNHGFDVGANDSMTDNMIGGDYDLTENPDLR